MMSWFRKILDAASPQADDLEISFGAARSRRLPSTAAVADAPTRNTVHKLSQFFYAGCFLAHLSRIEAHGANWERPENGWRRRAIALLDAIWNELGVPVRALNGSFSYDDFRAKSLAYDEGLAVLIDAARRSHDLRRWLIALGWRFLLNQQLDSAAAAETIRRVADDMGMTEADIAACSVPYVRSAAAFNDAASPGAGRALLGVSESATKAEIRGAFRELARKYHPDRHMSANPHLRELAQERFVRIREAYESLLDGASSTDAKTNGGEASRGTLFGLTPAGVMATLPIERALCFQCNHAQRLGASPGPDRHNARCDRCRAFLFYDKQTAERYKKQWQSNYHVGRSQTHRDPARSQNGANDPNAAVATRLFTTAMNHLRAERFKEAVETLTQVVSHDPAHATAQFNLGVCLGRLDRHEEAIEAFRQTIRLAPFHVTALVNLGISLSRLDRNDEAVDPFRRAIHLDRGHAPAHLNLGLALWQLGRGTEAAAALEEAAKLAPDDAAGRRLLGCVYMAQDRADDAATAFEQSAALDDGEASTYVNLGMCRGAMGLYTEAEAAFSRAVKITPDDETVHLRLGHIQMLADRIEPALESFDKALERRADWADATLYRGLCLAKLQRFADAADAFETAAATEGDSKTAPDPTALRLLGAARFEAGQHAAAVDAFRAAIKADPDDAIARLNLGMCHTARGQDADAIEALSKAIDLDPDLADAHWRLGLLLEDRARFGEAAAALEEVARLNPDHPYVADAVGRVCLKMNRSDDAAIALERALEPDKANPIVRFNLALAYHRSKRYAEALSMVDQALERVENDSAGHRLRGAILMSLERIDDAIAAFRRATDLSPDDRRAAKSLAQATHALDQAQSTIDAGETHG